MAEQPFVARERELAQLQTFLDSTLAGHGQVCFVTGEAGAGKPVLSVAEVTALVTEFARRARTQHDDLMVAIGNCNARPASAIPICHSALKGMQHHIRT